MLEISDRISVASFLTLNTLDECLNGNKYKNESLFICAKTEEYEKIFSDIRK